MRPGGVEILLIGELNSRLVQPRGQSEEELETSIANYSIVDETLHFVPRRKYRGGGGGVMEYVEIRESHCGKGGINYRHGT